MYRLTMRGYWQRIMYEHQCSPIMASCTSHRSLVSWKYAASLIARNELSVDEPGLQTMMWSFLHSRSCAPDDYLVFEANIIRCPITKVGHFDVLDAQPLRLVSGPLHSDLIVHVTPKRMVFLGLALFGNH